MASADNSDDVILDLDVNSSRSLKKHLACSACKAYPKAKVYFCGNGHNICSLCIAEWSILFLEVDPCPVDECKAKMMPITCAKTDFTDVVRQMKLPVPCKERENGCTDQHIMEKIKEHEAECEHRMITKWFLGDNLFKDFAAKVENVYIKEQKWHFKNRMADEEGKYRGVFKFFIGPDQRRFCLDIGNIMDGNAPLYVCVVGGNEVAKKYMAELRIYSKEENISVTFNGPVFPLDKHHHSDKKAFVMNPGWFENFNHGHQYFGDHNKDKNGEIVIPVVFKITKKELDIPADLVKDEETDEDEK